MANSADSDQLASWLYCLQRQDISALAGLGLKFNMKMDEIMLQPFSGASWSNKLNFLCQHY